MKRIPPSLNIRIIANPVAGRGRARRRLGQIVKAFGAQRITEIALTERCGDEERLTEEALAAGIETIVAVGGDGTCSRIAASILSRGSSCRLGVVPCGTGNDFAKTLGTAGLGASRIASLCASSSIARMDVGRVGELFFLNGCGFGIDPEILAATLRVKWLSGNAVYIVSAIGKLFTYRGFLAVNRVSPAAEEERRMMITVSNGRNLGGAFRIAPEASVCDGALDIHTFSDAPAARRLKLFLATFSGRHAALPEVRFERKSSIELTFLTAPPMEVDGELRQAPGATVRIECVPGALSVVAAPGFPL